MSTRFLAFFVKSSFKVEYNCINNKRSLKNLYFKSFRSHYRYYFILRKKIINFIIKYKKKWPKIIKLGLKAKKHDQTERRKQNLQNMYIDLNLFHSNSIDSHWDRPGRRKYSAQHLFDKSLMKINLIMFRNAFRHK